MVEAGSNKGGEDQNVVQADVHAAEYEQGALGGDPLGGEVEVEDKELEEDENEEEEEEDGDEGEEGQELR